MRHQMEIIQYEYISAVSIIFNNDDGITSLAVDDYSGEMEELLLNHIEQNNICEIILPSLHKIDTRGVIDEIIQILVDNNISIWVPYLDNNSVYLTKFTTMSNYYYVINRNVNNDNIKYKNVDTEVVKSCIYNYLKYSIIHDFLSKICYRFKTEFDYYLLDNMPKSYSDATYREFGFHCNCYLLVGNYTLLHRTFTNFLNNLINSKYDFIFTSASVIYDVDEINELITEFYEDDNNHNDIKMAIERFTINFFENE